MASQLDQVLPLPLACDGYSVTHVLCKAGQGEKVFSKDSPGSVLGQAFSPHFPQKVEVLFSILKLSESLLSFSFTMQRRTFFSF